MLYHLAPSSPPELLVVVAVGASTVTLQWNPPNDRGRNGIITAYTVACSERSAPLASNTLVTTTNLTVTFTELAPYSNYTCNVTASTAVGDGPAATATFVTLQDGEQ